MIDWIIPALFAGLVAIGVTVAIERMGGKKGGLLGTLPSTIIPASIGLYAATPSLTDFQDALFMTPAGMFVNSLFLFLWRIVPPRLPRWPSPVRLTASVLISMAGWAALAAVLINVVIAVEAERSMLSIAIIGFSAIFGIWACKKNPPAPKQPRRIGLLTLIARGLLAGAAIGLSVWLGTRGNPLIAGLAAVFPAIYLTTMCSLWLSHGEAAGAGAIGPMMLGGTSVSLYAWLAAWLIPTAGLAAGATISWVLAVGLVTLPAWRWLNPSHPR